MDNNSLLYGFVVVCVLAVGGIFISSSAVTGSNITEMNGYQFNFTENPHDHQILILDVNTFQFLNNTSEVTSGYIPVQIMPNPSDTTIKLMEAVDEHTHYKVN